MSPSYQPFDLRVDDQAIDDICRALYGSEIRNAYDDTVRVRLERSFKDRVYEVLNRAATLQRAERRKP